MLDILAAAAGREGSSLESIDALPQQRLRKVWHPQVYEKAGGHCTTSGSEAFPIPKGSPSLSLHSLKRKVRSNHRSRLVDPLVVGATHQRFTVHASIPKRDLQGRKLSNVSIDHNISS